MNTVKHFITSVTLLAALFTTGANAGHHEEGEMHSAPTIVEIAAGNADFSTLVAALKAAGLVEVLSGEGPFTVFAPTNAAFAKLPAGTVESLLEPENKQKLTDILTYHVVAGAVYAKDVVELTEATTVEGSTVDISASAAGVMIDNANVVTTDIKAS
ncbi:MAG TPA: fasciclin domain-containing protein, partial [Kineobactrum sp.]